MADENEKRKSEFSNLDTKQKSDAQVMMMKIIVITMRMIIMIMMIMTSVQARVMDVARIEGKIDTEFKNRKEDIEAIKTWYSPENDTRKVEIEELGKLANKENEARKEAINKLEAFVKSASVSAVGDLDARINAEAEARSAEDAALGDRITSIGKIGHLCVSVQKYE